MQFLTSNAKPVVILSSFFRMRLPDRALSAEKPSIMTERFMVAGNGVHPHHPTPEIFVPISGNRKNGFMDATSSENLKTMA